MAEQTGSRSPFSAFGSNKPPKPEIYPWLKPQVSSSATLANNAIKSLTSGSAAAESKYNAGTARQESLQDEQSGVLRRLLNRSLDSDPNALLERVGKTAFSFINPSVVEPLATADANAWEISRRARGINPASLDSTAERLRRARIDSGRYYDVARQAYAALPSLYGQVYNAGNTDAELARTYIPEIMAGYRRLDVSPLEAAMLRERAANAGTGILSNQANAAKAATYGFQQPKNFWDRLGDVDSALWGRLGESINMAKSLGSSAIGGIGGLSGIGSLAGSLPSIFGGGSGSQIPFPMTTGTGSLGGGSGGGSGGNPGYGPNSTTKSYFTPSYDAPAPMYSGYSGPPNASAAPWTSPFNWGGEFYGGPQLGPVYPWNPAYSGQPMPEVR